MSLVLFAGLPRSGSTLLLNILTQNPNLSVKAPSGLCKLLAGTNTLLSRAHEEQMKVMSDVDIPYILKSVVCSYHKDIATKIVIDKGRDWAAHLPYINSIMQEKCKIIFCVRDIPEIINSFRKLIEGDLFNTTLRNFADGEDRIGSLSSWVEHMIFDRSADSLLVLAQEIFELTEIRNYTNFLFVDYHYLCKNTNKELGRIYDFLETDHYQHDITNIKQTLHWKDYNAGFSEKLHVIKNTIDESIPDVDWIKNVLRPEDWESINKPSFWNKYIQ
jgi:hypothetical protein